MKATGWIWLMLGWPGVWLMASHMAPRLLASLPPDANAPTLSMAIALSGAQTSMLLVASAWAGSRLGPSLGLHSPLLEAWLERAYSPFRFSAWLSPRVQPILIAAAAGALLIAGGQRVMVELIGPGAASEGAMLPLAVRVLYGGITEELLVRFGLMTGLVWLLWRFAQGAQGKPEAIWMVLAIALSAVAFGAGHLPAAQALMGGLSPTASLFIVSANAVFGLIAGWLYWRHGLEAAVAAHVLAHLLAAGLTLAAGA